MYLPIGFDDFGKVVEKGLNYIDKSLFIKEILDDLHTEAIVITRPRRFGKTFNLSMLNYFLSKKVYGKETKDLFHDLAIAKCGQEYMQHQGKYPVILITFKDIKSSNFNLAFNKLNDLIADLYDKHNYLEKSDQLTPKQKELYAIILKGQATQSQLEGALKNLTEFLSTHHNIKPWLLIDEYDTPIQSAYSHKYYDKMIELMRGILGTALKNNPYLNKAVITGILRVAKESLFSGVNNLKVYSVLHQNYSSHFGFTEPEVDYILEQSHLSEKSKDIKEWYNGYQFGNTTIYNPWSIANCVQEKGHLKPYWIGTSDNQLIKDLLKHSPLQFKKDFEILIEGHTLEKFIDEHLAFQYLNHTSETLWCLLLMAGYLKPVSSKETDQGIFAQLAIPNREVRNLYRQIIEQWLSNKYGIEWYNAFIESLLIGKMDEFKEHLEKILLHIVSVHDMAKEPEAFYHGLLLGFMVSLHHTHEIKSNRESGLGRFDIIIIPKDLNQAGIVIELKMKGEKETLDACAQKALQQIEQKKYLEELKQRGIHQSIQVGIGFKGKECALAYLISQEDLK